MESNNTFNNKDKSKRREVIFPTAAPLREEKATTLTVRKSVNKIKRKNKNLYLNKKDTEKFYRFFEKKHLLIREVFLNLNIPDVEQDEYYSFALEGFLQSYLILQAGGVSRKNFDKYAFVAMKRHVIDEFRRRKGYRDVECCSYEDFSNSLISTPSADCDILYVELLSYLKSVLTKKEYLFLQEFLRTFSLKETMRALNISKTTAFLLQKQIRDKCEEFFKNQD